jgi:serine protease
VDAAAAVWAAAVIVEALFEVEANNTIASANPIGSTGNVVGNIGSATDTDHFLVQLPAGKTLTAVLTPFTSSADYDLYVVNASEAQLGASERGPGLAETVAVTNTGSATVARYVRVKYYSGVTGASNGKYTLKLTW